jgi:uncharacterized membrane protein YfcA
MRKYYEYNHKEIIGFIAVIIVSAISNSGGYGAGSVIIPVYVFFFGFATTDAIPLSRITIFAGALIQILFSWNQRNPKNKNKFLIDYNLASIMMPLILAGSMIGVIISRFFPGIVITISLILYLVYCIYKLFKKAQAMHQ